MKNILLNNVPPLVATRIKQPRVRFLNLIGLTTMMLMYGGVQTKAYAACSVASTQASTAKFINNSTQSVKLYWVDTKCVEKLYATIPAGSYQLMATFVNHVWRYKDATTNALIRETKVSSTTETSQVIPAVFSANLAGPKYAAINTTFKVTATIQNIAAAAYTNGTIKVSTTLPSGVTYVSATSASGGFACTFSGQVGSCSRSTVMAPNATDTITFTLKSTTTGAKTSNFAVSGGGSLGSVTSNSNTTTITNLSDLSVSVAQPVPTLKVSAMSQIELQVKNSGLDFAPAPINVTFILPPNVSAQQKFTRVADRWTCITSGQAVSCTYSQNLAKGANSRLRIPVIPAAITLNTLPGPFKATVVAAANETSLVNNGPVSMTPVTAVAALTLTSITDPANIANQIYSGYQMLDPTTIPKYSLPMPNLFASTYKHVPDITSIPGSNLYTLDIKRVKAQILPPGFPATDVYAYGDPARAETFSYPAHSIEARSTNSAVNVSGSGKPSKVQYLNTLADPNFIFFDAQSNQALIDRSILGASAGTPFLNAPAGIPEPDIRSVAHLQGATSIDQNSNGYPEAWHSPSGRNGIAVSANNPTVPYNPAPFDYNNNQESALLWFHDQTLGLTRLNVYAGLAGMYVLRDDNEMAMIASNKLPALQHEVPLVLQDRMFHVDGSLAYPDIYNVNGTFAPSPSWVPEFYGDVMVVNGVAWPYYQVEPRKYRFRVLNASNSRYYKLSLENSKNLTAVMPFQVIGTDGGFLNAPASVNTLVMAPGERYDIVIDFATLKGTNITLKNSAGNLFGNSVANSPEVPPTAGLTDQLMQFRVNLPLTSAPTVTLPASLRAPIAPLTASVAAPRQVMLWETTNDFNRVAPIMGTPDLGKKYWVDLVTETPTTGSVETWEIYNNTILPQPIHIHGASFQVVERQEFNAVQHKNVVLGLPFIEGQLSDFTFPAPAVVPPVAEQGWKDTVTAYPSPAHVLGSLDGDIITGQVTRIRVKFNNPGQFLWQSQRLEAQEHEMIRPLIVSP